MTAMEKVAWTELTAGDRVVVEGNERLQPGERIRVLEEVEYE